MSLLLLSGGMDSALCLARYGADLTVAFDYGQSHKMELRYAERIAKHYRAPFEHYRIPTIPLIDDVVFAGRNAILLSCAASIAQHRGLRVIIIGCNATDAARFPDCSAGFIGAMDSALTNAYGVRVDAPLIHMTKEDVVVAATAEDVPPTWSCYGPGPEPCGKCLACKLRNGQ